MRTRITALLAASTLLLISANTSAADIEAGKAKAATCTACHGVEGASSNDLWPSLKGQQKGYLVKQIKAFKSGDRKDPLMSSMAAALTDDDIENVAAYFNSLK